jgi:hypothetical protein
VAVGARRATGVGGDDRGGQVHGADPDVLDLCPAGRMVLSQIREGSSVPPGRRASQLTWPPPLRAAAAAKLGLRLSRDREEREEQVESGYFGPTG